MAHSDYSGGNYPGLVSIMNSTGTVNSDCIPVANFASVLGGTTPGSGFNNLTTNANTSSLFGDTTNYRTVCALAQDLTGNTTPTDNIYTIDPNITTSTNFNLPDVTVNNRTQIEQLS